MIDVQMAQRETGDGWMERGKKINIYSLLLSHLSIQHTFSLKDMVHVIFISCQILSWKVRKACWSIDMWWMVDGLIISRKGEGIFYLFFNHAPKEKNLKCSSPTCYLIIFCTEFVCMSRENCDLVFNEIMTMRKWHILTYTYWYLGRQLQCWCEFCHNYLYHS